MKTEKLTWDTKFFGFKVGRVTIQDPLANPEEVKHEYKLICHPELGEGQKFDAIVLTVAHKEFMSLDFEMLKAKDAVVYDVKGVLEKVEGKLQEHVIR